MSAVNVESHIGQYKILRTLGAGGMGTVYLGEHLLLGRRAAIKTLLPTLSSHREIVDRFFTEARAISTISDPGVVQIFDFGYHVDGTAYIVMEYLEGESLSARLDRLGKLPPADGLRIARQLASSLSSAHALGIVHRDLKPGNVFIIRDPEAHGGERTKILDFGICKLGDPEHAHATQTGTMLGTPVYMSPEQCRGAGKVDHRSDIYSLGCVLFHVLTGRPPFDCDSVGDFIAAHLKDVAPPPSELATELPPTVDALLARCLAKDPDERFQSMTELQSTLDQVVARISDSGVAEPAPVVPTTPLGDGFKSAYDVNAGNANPNAGQTSPPSHDWFVDSMSSVRISDHWEQPRRRTRLGKYVALLGALLLGIAGGLAGTSYALQREQLKEAPVPDAPAIVTLEEAAPAPSFTQTAQEPAPPPAADDETDAIAEAPAQRAPAAKQASRSPRPTAKKPPRGRRAIRETTPVPAQTEDDLYDTR